MLCLYAMDFHTSFVNRGKNKTKYMYSSFIVIVVYVCIMYIFSDRSCSCFFFSSDAKIMRSLIIIAYIALIQMQICICDWSVYVFVLFALEIVKFANVRNDWEWYGKIIERICYTNIHLYIEIMVILYTIWILFPLFWWFP